MKGLYLLAKMVVEKKFPDDAHLRPFYISAMYGLLCKYKNYAELVCDLFLKTDIIMDNKPVSEILVDHNIDIEFGDEDTENERTYAVSNQGHLFIYDEKTDSILYDKENPFIICSTMDVSMTHLLNTFCHEMNHIIKGEINGYRLHRMNKDYEYYLRTGLAHYIYKYNDKEDSLTEYQQFSNIDEAVNCIQTTEIMKEILNLRSIVDDHEMKSFFELLDEEKMIKDHGYEDIVINVRKLWECDNFKKAIEEGLIDGDIDHIIRRFNKLIDDDEGFWKLNNIIDTLNSIFFDEEMTEYYKTEEMKKLNEMVKKLKKSR